MDLDYQGGSQRGLQVLDWVVRHPEVETVAIVDVAPGSSSCSPDPAPEVLTVRPARSSPGRCSSCRPRSQPRRPAALPTGPVPKCPAAGSARPATRRGRGVWSVPPGKVDRVYSKTRWASPIKCIAWSNTDVGEYRVNSVRLGCPAGVAPFRVRGGLVPGGESGMEQPLSPSGGPLTSRPGRDTCPATQFDILHDRKQPAVDMIRYGLQPRVVDALSVYRRHVGDFVPHDAVRSWLVFRAVGDCPKHVAKGVEL